YTHRELGTYCVCGCVWVWVWVGVCVGVGVCVCVGVWVCAVVSLCVSLYSPDDSVSSEKYRGIVLGILQQFLSQRYRPGTPVYTYNERQRQTDEKRPLRFDN